MTGPSSVMRSLRAILTALLLLVAGVVFAASASAAVTFTLNSLTATVNGGTVAASASVTSSASTTVPWYGVCVRSASGANFDYPKRANVAFAAGVPQTTQGTATFAVGTYTYYACVYYGGVWSRVGNAKQFTVSPPPPPPGQVGPRSRLPWTSGAYLDHDAANIGPFETGRGRALDAVTVFPTRDSQTALLNAWWLPAVTPVTSNGGWAVVTVPLWTADQSVSTDTTSLFTQLGQQINANLPPSRTLVRLGWEMNLPSQYWNVTSANRAAWVADFQRAAALLRQYAPGVKIAFNPNEGPSQTTLADVGQLAVDLAGSFDYVGPDFYNWYPQMDTAATWTSRYNESYGLAFWENWAAAHGKGYTVPEWGVTKGVNNSTGVLYVQQMVARFAAVSGSGVSVIESYFNESATFLQSSLWNPQQNPEAAQAYHDALAGQPVAP